MAGLVQVVLSRRAEMKKLEMARSSAAAVAGAGARRCRRISDDL